MHECQKNPGNFLPECQKITLNVKIIRNKLAQLSNEGRWESYKSKTCLTPSMRAWQVGQQPPSNTRLQGLLGSPLLHLHDGPQPGLVPLGMRSSEASMLTHPVFKSVQKCHWVQKLTGCLGLIEHCLGLSESVHCSHYSSFWLCYLHFWPHIWQTRYSCLTLVRFPLATRRSNRDASNRTCIKQTF